MYPGDINGCKCFQNPDFGEDIVKMIRFLNRLDGICMGCSNVITTALLTCGPKISNIAVLLFKSIPGSGWR
jgi:hypothetical protein